MQRVSPQRLAVLASGRGSNLQAILDAIAEKKLNASVVGVFSDCPNAPALLRVSTDCRWSEDARAFGSRKAFDDALAQAVAATHPHWVVCAGYMRILGPAFVSRFGPHILNIHPSLLPRHKGLHTHARVLQAGDRTHGASVHLVTDGLDEGRVLAQATVQVLPDDTPELLAQRVLQYEHPLYVATLRLLVDQRLRANYHQVFWDDVPLAGALHLTDSGCLSQLQTILSDNLSC